MKPPYSEMQHDENGTFVTDDVSFFEKLRLAGGILLGDADVRVGHLGQRSVVCDLTADELRKEHLRLAGSGDELKRLFDKTDLEKTNLGFSGSSFGEDNNGNNQSSETGKSSVSVD